METGILNQQSDRSNIRQLVWLLGALCLLVSACATDAFTEVTDQTVTYQVIWLATPDGAVGPTRAVLGLNEEFAVLDGNTGCHRVLGSFTLDDATGDASFTVPGASKGKCQPGDQLTEDWLLAALDRVASFQRVDLRLELADSAGDLQIQLEPIS